MHEDDVPDLLCRWGPASAADTAAAAARVLKVLVTGM
jgi:hypothetical protein